MRSIYATPDMRQRSLTNLDLDLDPRPHLPAGGHVGVQLSEERVQVAHLVLHLRQHARVLLLQALSRPPAAQALVLRRRVAPQLLVAPPRTVAAPGRLHPAGRAWACTATRADQTQVPDAPDASGVHAWYSSMHGQVTQGQRACVRACVIGAVRGGGAHLMAQRTRWACSPSLMTRFWYRCARHSGHTLLRLKRSNDCRQLRWKVCVQLSSTYMQAQERW